jgi:hypothetical protein
MKPSCCVSVWLQWVEWERSHAGKREQDVRNRFLNVIMKERIHQKFAIADRQIVWHGSINSLSCVKSGGRMMHFENREIAEELLVELKKDMI